MTSIPEVVQFNVVILKKVSYIVNHKHEFVGNKRKLKLLLELSFDIFSSHMNVSQDIYQTLVTTYKTKDYLQCNVSLHFIKNQFR